MTAPFLHHGLVLAAYPAHVGLLTVVIKSLPESKNLGFVHTLTTRDVELDSLAQQTFSPNSEKIVLRDLTTTGRGFYTQRKQGLHL